MRDIEIIEVDNLKIEVGVITVKEISKFQTLSKKLDNLKDLEEEEKNEKTLKEIFLFLCKVNDIKITEEEYFELSLIPLTKVVSLFAEKNKMK